jgi:hypothetical protein
LKTLRILEQIELTLSNILVANGYFTDIGNKLEYWSNEDTEYDQEKLTYRDEECELTREGTEHEHKLTVEIEAIAFTADPKTTGCELLGDIYRAVGSNLDWGGNAIDTMLVKNEKAIVTEGKTAVRVIVTVEVLYRTGLWEN